MQHEIPIEQLGPHAAEMAQAVGSCVHCGFCLPTCPTYVAMGEEMDSPRGRILLMKEVLEGGLELEAAMPFIDNCLGCRACETACPSGVVYGDLITPFRAYAEDHAEGRFTRRLRRGIVLRTLQSPRLLRLTVRLGRLAQPIAHRALRRFSASTAAMLELLPRRLGRTSALPELHPAQGAARARVGLLTGCAQQALAPQINAATLRVLARNGIETVIPRGQVCCGALALHAGAFAQARSRARRNLEAFGQELDAIVACTAGCSSGMKEYGLLFEAEAERERARGFADRVLDVSVLLDRLGLSATPPDAGRPLRIVYQDACHLAHAQSVRSQPRRLLRAIGNVTLIEPADWELCCGSAGTYNLDRPSIASRLGRRKAESLLATRPDLIVSGNIGCIVQLQAHLRALGDETPVLHTIEALDRAYAGRL